MEIDHLRPAATTSPGASTGALTATGRLAAPGSRDDLAAFEVAVRPHYASLVRRLVVVLGSEHDAEDVAQDAYLRAFRSWDRFDGTDVRAWLYTIGLRLAFNHLRRHRRWLAAIQRIEPRTWTDPADPDLWAALRGLDIRTRSALLLNVVDGYTQREIAVMLAVPEGTVASWLSRGRARLREELTSER
jgi:RNA polymerase sigma-70 factor (ECF subfamily)